MGLLLDFLCEVSIIGERIKVLILIGIEIDYQNGYRDFKDRFVQDVVLVVYVVGDFGDGGVVGYDKYKDLYYWF